MAALMDSSEDLGMSSCIQGHQTGQILLWLLFFYFSIRTSVLVQVLLSYFCGSCEAYLFFLLPRDINCGCSKL